MICFKKPHFLHIENSVFIDYYVITDIMLFENIAKYVYSSCNTKVMQHMLAV